MWLLVVEVVLVVVTSRLFLRLVGKHAAVDNNLTDIHHLAVNHGDGGQAWREIAIKLIQIIYFDHVRTTGGNFP